MTERVDQDRLADFVGGALDGTPDAAAVRTLVETDAGWAAAHADLVAATAAVSADLRTVGSRPHAVPEEVAARLDALFRPVEPDSGAGAAPPAATGVGSGESATAHDTRSKSATGGSARPGPRGDGARSDGARSAAVAGGPGGPGGPGGSSRPGGAGPGRRAQSRRMRWAAGLSAAAAVIAVGIGIVATLPGTRYDESPSAGSGADTAGGAANQAAEPPTIASGRDYQPGSFGDLGAGRRSSQVRGAPEPPAAAESGREGKAADDPAAPQQDLYAAAVPPELARLKDAVARQNCLDAIRQAHGGAPGVVDFARFAGRPALVVLLDGSTTGNGKQWVVVAGPDCGLVPGDVDELYNGPLA